jgi:hypothetical protein
MRRVYFGSDNIITSLGFTTEENARRMLTGNSGIKVLGNEAVFPGSVAYSAINTDELDLLFSSFLKSRMLASEINLPAWRRCSSLRRQSGKILSLIT